MTGPSKPDWCPAEVWERAAAVFEVNSHEPVSAYGLLCIASRAILAERERAAKVASQFVDGRLYKPKFPACSYHAGEIAAAIRGGS